MTGTGRARQREEHGQRPKRAAAAALAMVPLGLLLATQLAQTPPDRMPVAWSGMNPSAWIDGGEIFGAIAVLVSAAALFAAVVSLVPFILSASIARVLVAAAAATGAGALLYYMLVGGRARVDPDQVGLVWPALAVTLGLSWGWVVYRVRGRHVLPLADVIAGIPEPDRLPAAPGDSAPTAPMGSWRGTSQSSYLAKVSLATGASFAAAFGYLLYEGYTWSGIAVGLLGAALTTYTWAWSQLTVQVDVSGLTLRSGRLPVRLGRIPAHDVVGLRAEELDPMLWGGYGLRRSRGRVGYLVTGGRGLVVHRADGLSFGVELTDVDPVPAVSVLRRAAVQARAWRED